MLRRIARHARATTAATLTAVLMSLAPPAAAAPGGDMPVTSAVAVRSAESAQIDEWVMSRMAAHDLPGTAVAVVRDGEVVHLAGYGVAGPDGEPVTADTPFLIGSASKPFTAALVGQLIDEGQLSLDDPVAPHLEPVVADVPDGFEDATVAQLLTHTGGLGMDVGLAGTVELYEGEDALDRRVVDLLGEPLSTPPGTRFEYSNAGAPVLAAVAEQVTGRPFDQLLRERVLDPLGMNASFASGDDPRGDDLAMGHRRWFGQWRATELPYDDAGVAMGYVGATARDLAPFLQTHLDGHPAVPATADEVAERRVVGTGWDIPAEGGYGLGWFVDELGGERVVSHSGSLAHFTAHLLMAPDEDLGVAVLSNASSFVTSGHEGQYDVSIGLMRLLLGQTPEPTGPDPALTYGAPVVLWGLVVLLGVAAMWFVVRTLPRWRREPGALQGRRGLRRVFLPAIAYLAVGVVLWVVTPLEAARHFSPDLGWAATVLAFGLPAWAVVRTAAVLPGRAPTWATVLGGVAVTPSSSVAGRVRWRGRSRVCARGDAERSCPVTLERVCR